MTSKAEENKPKPVAKKAVKSKAKPRRVTASKKKPLNVKMTETTPTVIDVVDGYEIEAGVPVPPAKVANQGKQNALARLEVGTRMKEFSTFDESKKYRSDEEKDKARYEGIRRAKVRLANAMRKHVKKFPAKEFVVRETDFGAACWRLK